VIDYGYSAASYIPSRVLGRSGSKRCRHIGFVAERASQAQPIAESLGQPRRSWSRANSADLGRRFDRRRRAQST